MASQKKDLPTEPQIWAFLLGGSCSVVFTRIPPGNTGNS